LTLAREVVGQVFDSRTVGRTVSAAEGLWRAATCAIGVSGSVDLDDYGRDATLVSSLQPVFDFFYERYWRVRVEGIDHVPEGPAILVANHSGALPFDGPMVAQALVRERADLNQARWLLEDQVFHAPFLGTLANRLGAIRACPENALRLLDEERPIIVFPEGIQGIGKTYKDRYQLKRFGRGGFVKLALRAGAPIIPVAVVGAEESMPVLFKLPGGLFGVPYLPVTPLGPLPLPARWAIRFGEPIDLGGATADDEHDLPRVQRLAERTRESIQGMLTALLEERSSVF
jgi:1-acyl-sn-glycerol-3-phosphate acyltransferase